MQITRKDLLTALRSRLLTKIRSELELHQKKLNDLDKDEPKECLSDSADALGTAKIKNSAAFKTLVGKLDKAKLKYTVEESHVTDYDRDKPGQRRTTLTVRVRFEPFTVLTTPSKALLRAIEFVVYTLRPWVVRFEQRLKIELLSPQDRVTHFIKFNVDGLLRGDIQTRYNAYHVAKQDGWLNADEIRELEDMNPIPNGKGEAYWQPVNMGEVGKIPAPQPQPSNQQQDKVGQGGRI
jgi:hypothetical protein